MYFRSSSGALICRGQVPGCGSQPFLLDGGGEVSRSLCQVWVTQNTTPLVVHLQHRKMSAALAAIAEGPKGVVGVRHPDVARIWRQFTMPWLAAIISKVPLAANRFVYAHIWALDSEFFRIAIKNRLERITRVSYKNSFWLVLYPPNLEISRYYIYIYLHYIIVYIYICIYIYIYLHDNYMNIFWREWQGCLLKPLQSRSILRWPPRRKLREHRRLVPARSGTILSWVQIGLYNFSC